MKILAPVESTAAVTENQAKNDEITLTHSFIIAPKQLKENWPPQKIAELTERHLQAVIDLQPELVLLGTGKSLEFPSPSITQSLFTKGIGVEIMDTAAACRTYNVLMHEGRKVVAALIVN
ncbi:MAG: hypothetical protein AMJ53_17720 [Gammaproteobacteria bacterium SG8_11]|nr:MAG: hypothetical protein AMJ53_17720 [Gammaproteobacteria bacterium SG8_11]